MMEVPLRALMVKVVRSNVYSQYFKISGFEYFNAGLKARCRFKSSINRFDISVALCTIRIDQGAWSTSEDRALLFY